MHWHSDAVCYLQYSSNGQLLLCIAHVLTLGVGSSRLPSWTRHQSARAERLFMGTAGLEASQQYDAHLLAGHAARQPAVCSKPIYNSQGSVDEKTINGPSFIVNLATHIKASASDDGEDKDIMQFHNFFSSFLWAMRDFVNEDGDPISSNDLRRESAGRPVTRHRQLEAQRHWRRTSSGTATA
ncbi:hypothetical protein PHYSODRAFT_307890 [Phytophthora sojae]|uniref:Guanylate-binding protein N-terminal domain-containing protein n=1 Tax=Phytophthora sojae (strain P6497) TaxID=1094619 RepID=G5AGR3_PHYSP|nr:hypothetical protein PHYSODRAFT_307890 [Phytophthora sojae]EGZ05343.1 hypothetical protein PHYSODRAFT_307890 [Phytophthora sojae]|eukprot:XP_009539264.1 hypothetical protein PHYSODRAFT_307890 [Phytophthora sojae]